MTDIFINKKVWRRFDDREMEDYVESVFRYYRKNGFPYYSTDKEYRQKEFEKLQNYKRTVMGGNIIRQTMHGLALCWSYHPHAFEVVCRDKLTPYEIFHDDDMLRKVIRRRIKIGDNMSDAGMRKMLKIYSGAQSVSNFRPTVAKAIYDKYAPNGKVWDMSMGYGGRILGFEVSKAKEYIGTDPCTNNFMGTTMLANDFLTKPFRLYKTGSEDFVPDVAVDLVFTSPPYFDIEKYSDEPTQSYVKYPTMERWLNGFLSASMYNAYNSLKVGGHLILNVNKELEYHVIDIATYYNVELVQTYKLAMSKINGSGFKYEPILVFKKVG